VIVTTRRNITLRLQNWGDELEAMMAPFPIMAEASARAPQGNCPIHCNRGLYP